MESDLLQEIIDLAEGSTPRITIISSASELDEDELFDSFAKIAGKTSVKNFSQIHTINRAQAFDPDNIDKAVNADIIFFTGGDQEILVERLDNTPLMEAVLQRNKDGALIAGTSAGAVSMCNPMINGGSPKKALKKGAIYLAKGFNVISKVIFDSHFTERLRLKRLYNLVAQDHEKIGVGLDENTAAVFRGDGSLEVIGQNSVVIVDGSAIADKDQAKNVKDGDDLDFSGIKSTRLPAGSVYRYQ
jgi:cyanophycinase